MTYIAAKQIEYITDLNQLGIQPDELPTYFPHLNLIEILWRFIKYEWIPIDAYKDWKTFVASVEKILKEFGENYVIILSDYLSYPMHF